MTEADYIVFSQLLRDTINTMQMLRKIKINRFPTISTSPEVHCRAFEDNSGALELARTPKIRPSSKHINQVYHHSQDFVQNGTIHIFEIESENQMVDIFTKPLPQNYLICHRKKLFIW